MKGLYILIPRDSFTRFCVAALYGFGAVPAQAADRYTSFFCADPDAGSARLVVTAPDGGGVTIHPGRHKASGSVESLAWSDGPTSFVLQDETLVIVSDGQAATLHCVDVTLHLRSITEEVVRASPEIQAALKKEELAVQLSVAESVNDALQAQLDELKRRPDLAAAITKAKEPLRPLCAKLVDLWQDGGANDLIAILGVVTAASVQACRDEF